MQLNDLKYILNAFSNQLYRKVLVIEVLDLKDNEENRVYYNGQYLTLDKNNVTIQNQTELTSLNELEYWAESYAEQKLPVLILINSDKILHTKVNLTDIDTYSENILKETFPDIEINDFYNQLISIDNDSAILSIVRKKYVEDRLASLTNIFKNIIYVSIGPFYVLKFHEKIFNIESNREYTINFLNYSFHYKVNTLSDYETEPFEKKSYLDNKLNTSIKTSSLSYINITPYSFGLYYFLSPPSLPSINYEPVKRNLEEYIFDKKSRAIGYSYAIILFCILLISSLMFSSYQKKFNNLEQINYGYLKDAERNKELKGELEKRKEILETNGLLSTNKITSTTDLVIRSMPENMYLTHVAVYPELNSYSSKEVFFNDKIIEVSGMCNNPGELKNWVSVLKNIDWITDVNVQQYKQVEKSDFYSFKLIITK